MFKATLADVKAGAKDADAELALAEAMRKYSLIDVSGASKLYADAKTAVCNCVLKNMNMTTAMAVYILVIEASKHLK